jgi:hypothetical protein
MLHIYIVKIDRGVAHIAMVIHLCCKLLFQMFHLFFQTCCKCVYLDMAYVSHICCKCVVCHLHMFCNGFFKCFYVFF